LVRYKTQSEKWKKLNGIALAYEYGGFCRNRLNRGLGVKLSFDWVSAAYTRGKRLLKRPIAAKATG
jgi:hypothetical protein